MECFKLYVDRLQRLLQDDPEGNNYFIRLLASIEAHFDIPRSYQAIAIQIVVIIFLVFGRFAQFISHLFAIVYPFYDSLKTLELPHDNEMRQQKVQHLVCYWVIFSLVLLIDYLVIFHIPFYWPIRTGFLVWCQVFNGATIVYNILIKPNYMKYQNSIDAFVIDVKHLYNKFVYGNNDENEGEHMD